jgi:uncharacterized membrane protein YsdA (DUF1294 family)
LPSPVVPAVAALAAANVWAFGLFWFDKARSRGQGRRVPERTLLWAAFFGGPGAWLGQQLLRHKTRKEPFRTQLGWVLTLHLIGLAGLIWLAAR